MSTDYAIKDEMFADSELKSKILPGLYERLELLEIEGKFLLNKSILPME